MAEYFGYEVEESYDGELGELLDGVDPILHAPISWGLSQLCQWYGDKAYRQLDEWFTIVYGVALYVEEAVEDQLPTGQKLDFSGIEAV